MPEYTQSHSKDRKYSEITNINEQKWSASCMNSTDKW